MSVLKKQVDIDIIIAGGKILHEIKQKLIAEIQVGKVPLHVDNLAKKLIKDAGGSPSFMTVGDYKWATCISVNDEVVHGVPDLDTFQEGDVVGLDVGMEYKGWHTDTSYSIRIKNQKSKIKDNIDKFLDIGQLALKKAIAQARPGNRIGHISKTIQDIVEGSGYSVVKTLVGHGIGRELHEAPHIPGILTKKIEKTPLIEIGMALAIEVIYNMGRPEIVYKNDDGWTLATDDGSISGLFEETVLVTQKEPVILT
jgi:methionyl aminopeptidase